MKDLLIADASHPITESLRLPCSRDVAQCFHDGVSQWLHDRCLPDGSVYLIFLATMWHVCSLMHLDLFQHCPIVDATHQYPEFLLACRRGFDGGRTHARPTADLFERLGSAWPSHPTHVVRLGTLTSPTQGGPFRVNASGVSTIDGMINADAKTVLEATRVACMQDSSGAGAGAGSIAIAWCLGASDVLNDVGPDGPEECRVWMEDAEDGTSARMCQVPDGQRTAHVFEERVYAQARGSAIDMVSSVRPGVLDRTDAPRTRSTSGTMALQDPHEARGVGLVIKALVQQNEGASLFLRTVTYAATLLCSVHSMLVLGWSR